MEGKKNLCAMIPAELHAKIMTEKEEWELNTLAEYVERIFVEHFEGGNSMKAERTLAVQIPAELFDRLKEYLVAHNLKQKQFLIQLIESALEDTEKEYQPRGRPRKQPRFLSFSSGVINHVHLSGQFVCKGYAVALGASRHWHHWRRTSSICSGADPDWHCSASGADCCLCLLDHPT